MVDFSTLFASPNRSRPKSNYRRAFKTPRCRHTYFYYYIVYKPNLVSVDLTNITIIDFLNQITSELQFVDICHTTIVVFSSLHIVDFPYIVTVDVLVCTLLTYIT